MKTESQHIRTDWLTERLIALNNTTGMRALSSCRVTVTVVRFSIPRPPLWEATVTLVVAVVVVAAAAVGTEGTEGQRIVWM
jgi:hypothetical protein